MKSFVIDRLPSLSPEAVPGDAFSAQIAGELETDIVFGRLRPGQKLPEEELAERFGATRHQVREALSRLERTGIVVKERNKGVTVRRYGIEEVGEIYEVREILQRHAALRIPLPAPKESIVALEAIHTEYEEAIARGDFHAIQKSNDRFHTELFRLCGNESRMQFPVRFPIRNIRCGLVEPHDGSAVYLMEPMRRRQLQEEGQVVAIGHHPREVIPAAGPEIQMIERRL